MFLVGRATCPPAQIAERHGGAAAALTPAPAPVVLQLEAQFYAGPGVARPPCVIFIYISPASTRGRAGPQPAASGARAAGREVPRPEGPSRAPTLQEQVREALGWEGAAGQGVVVE